MILSKPLMEQSSKIRVFNPDCRRTITTTIRTTIARMAGSAVVRLGKITQSSVARREITDFFEKVDAAITYQRKFPYAIDGVVTVSSHNPRQMRLTVDKIVENEVEWYTITWTVN